MMAHSLLSIPQQSGLRSFDSPMRQTGNEPPLRVMLIDERQERAAMVEQSLTALGLKVVARLTPGANLPARIRECNPDVILVETDSPNRDVLEEMHGVSRETPKPIVMFTNGGDTETIRAAIRAGVSAYVADGLHPERIRPIVDSAMASFQAFQSLREELEETRQTLAERKVIDKAKGILMKQRGFDEETAFRALRKAAMDRNKRLAEVAQDLIDMASLLG